MAAGRIPDYAAPRGERVVLLNVEKYSASTTQHLNHVRGALGRNAYQLRGGEQGRSHQGYRVFGVRYVQPSRCNGAGDQLHSKNVEWLLEKASAAYSAGLRRRSADRRDWDMAQAEQYLSTARAYSEAFDLPALPESLADVTAAIQANQLARAAQIAAANAERSRREVERLAAQRLEDAEAFAAWQAGAPGSRCPYSYRVDEHGSAYVRRHIAGDEDELQTSQGANVPWRHAVLAYKQAKRCRARSEAWEANGHTIKVGVYSVSRISVEGDLTAGCHVITWARMLALAEKEGVA